MQKRRPSTDHPYSFAASRRCTRAPFFWLCMPHDLLIQSGAFLSHFECATMAAALLPSTTCRCSRLKHRTLSAPQQFAGAKRPPDPTYKFPRTGMVLHTQPSTSLSCTASWQRTSKARESERSSYRRADGEALGCHVQPPCARVARLGIPAGPIPGPLPGMRPALFLSSSYSAANYYLAPSCASSRALKSEL